MMPASSCSAAVLGSHHGLDHIEGLLVEPHRHQHGQRLVVVELVALRDGLDPAGHPPRVEIEPATGNPVALTGQPARRKQFAQRCRRLAKHVVVPGAHRPHSNVEHLGSIGTLFEQGSQRRADIAGRRLRDRHEFQPVRGDAQPDQITGRHAQRGEPPGPQQQHSVAVNSSLGHAACGQDVAGEERGRVGDRRAVGEPLIGVARSASPAAPDRDPTR